MAGPQNAIIGDYEETSLPELKLDDRDLSEEKRRARFSKTKEFQILKEHLNLRIAHYQHNLPGGGGLESANIQQRGEAWSVADAVIGELKAVIQAYEDAAEIVKERSK